MAENIVHLVLARTPDAPPGTKGISCFIVPKFLVNDDGSLGERNDVTCVSIEHKMGIQASPTCVLVYGEDGGAVGYLIGEENQGMRYMFTMMNNARLSVGLEGLALAERAYQQAVRLTPRNGCRAAPSAATAGVQAADHRARRRPPDAADHEGPHRGHAGPHVPQRPVHRPLVAPPRRGRAPGAPGASPTSHPAVARPGAPTWASRSPRWPSRSMAAWATSRRPAWPSTSGTPASHPSTRARTASRPWTWSGASCRCGAGRWSPTPRPDGSDRPSPGRVR